MMKHLLNTMRAQAIMAQGGKATVRLGLVSSYDPGSYCVKVRLQPEDFETGWLPLAAPWSGNGWGMFCPPTPGDMIEVQFQEGSAEAGIACMRLYSDADRPLNVPSGEFWLVHKSGSFVKTTNDGKVSISDKAGSTVVLNGDGTATATFSGGLTVNANTQINGTLKVSGDITDQSATNTRTVAGMRTQYNGHTHTDPQGGSVGAANPSM